MSPVRLALPQEVLTVVVGLLLVALGLLVTGLVAATAADAWRQRRLAGVRAELGPHLRRVVVDGSRLRSASGLLARLPWREQVDELAALRRTVSGESRERIAELADRTGLLARAHRWVGSRRWHRRLRAARVLTLAGRRASELSALLVDPHWAVRAQAAGWIAEHGTGDEVAAMLEALDRDPPLRGYVLVDCLARAGSRASAALVDFLDRNEPHGAEPALTAATRLADARFAPTAMRWSHAAAPTERAAAARLLAAVGDPGGIERLRELLADEEGRVRATAATGLGRLQHWPAAPDLARVLADPVFAVRHAAGLALRRLGPAGELYLRRTLRSEDTTATELARQVLSLPEEVVA